MCVLCVCEGGGGGGGGGDLTQCMGTRPWLAGRYHNKYNLKTRLVYCMIQCNGVFINLCGIFIYYLILCNGLLYVQFQFRYGISIQILNIQNLAISQLPVFKIKSGWPACIDTMFMILHLEIQSSMGVYCYLIEFSFSILKINYQWGVHCYLEQRLWRREWRRP